MSVISKPLAGRAETLTEDQENVLKQVWMYMLHYSGVNVNPPGPLTRSRTNSNVSRHVSQTSTVQSHEKRKGGLLGRLKKNKNPKDKENEGEPSVHHHQDLKRTLSGQSGIDPSVKHATDIKVHAALKNLDSNQVIDTFWNALRHDLPDNLLLRFIRARKWEVDEALIMIANTLEWRSSKSHVDKILKSGELGCKEQKMKGVMTQFRKGKCIIRGTDKLGRPLVIVRPRYHLSSDQNSEEIEVFTLLLIEYARLLLTEPIDQCVLIFDLTGFTMSNMEYEPVKFITAAFEAHYPESLGVLLIHKAPWIFSGIWAVVKKWLDPVVASKINFTKTTADLEKWISKDQILSDLGGDDDYVYEYLEPTPELNGLKDTDDKKLQEIQNERKALYDEFVQKTVAWIESKTIEESKALFKERLGIGYRLSENYKIYDGFVRNRGLYDRLGYVTFE